MNPGTTVRKPDFVTNFQKPVNTEIKHIGGHWYLYERHNKYDPKKKRSVKVSGKCLGSVTENGLVPSRKRARAPEAPSLGDIVETGAVGFFYGRTKAMRQRLQKHFPDTWREIYTIVLIRTIYDVHFRRLELHYENSILSYLYPGFSFTPPAVRDFLTELGRRRNEISSFMKESLAGSDGCFILFDGHRLITASRTMDNAEPGYDSKCRYKPQINLIYIYTLGKGTGFPAYYKQYMGSTPDVVAFRDVLKEAGIRSGDATVITDKGFASGDGFDLLAGSGLKYIMPLKRGNSFVKGKVPSSPAGYDDLFSYHGRAVQAKKFALTGCNVFLFFDSLLFADEMSDLAGRTEKSNAAIVLRRRTEEERRGRRKGRLSDAELAELVPLTVKDVLADKAEMGTITIQTNRTDLNSEQVYAVWKQRQNIEQYFKTYDDTMDCEASYMRGNDAEEAWLFLNHLSSTIGINTIEEIAGIGESKNISLKDLIQTLRKIKAGKLNGTWQIPPVKKSVSRLCGKMKFDPTAFDLPIPETKPKTGTA